MSLAAKLNGNFRYDPVITDVEKAGEMDLAKPYYKESGDEIAVGLRTFAMRRPLVLKGPTGCGKTTYAHMLRYLLNEELKDAKHNKDFRFDEDKGIYVPQKKDAVQQASLLGSVGFPLYIVDGNEDLEAIHLLGGYNSNGKYVGGPMYHWAHTGGILLVNELKEIRSNVLTIFHGALDKDRIVTFPDIGKIVRLPDHAMMIGTYNPEGSALKISTRQRIPAISFNYPGQEAEAEIIYHASAIGGLKCSMESANTLSKIASSLRTEVKSKSILASGEGVSTRLFVIAAEYIAQGVKISDAIKTAVIEPLAENGGEAKVLEDVVKMHLP